MAGWLAVLSLLLTFQAIADISGVVFSVRNCPPASPRRFFCLPSGRPFEITPKSVAATPVFRVPRDDRPQTNVHLRYIHAVKCVVVELGLLRCCDPDQLMCVVNLDRHSRAGQLKACLGSYPSDG